MRYTFLASARAELREAMEFYDSRQSGLGREFAEEVKATVVKILDNPTIWRKISENARRCRLQRFPYALIYQIKPDRIRIVAVMHLRRNPTYWHDRLES